MSAIQEMRDVIDEFPVLRREFDGRPVVYLDSSATSLTPTPVLDAMDHYYRDSRASVHRGVYPLAVEATDQFEGALAKVRAMTDAISELAGSAEQQTRTLDETAVNVSSMSASSAPMIACAALAGSPGWVPSLASFSLRLGPAVSA